MPTRIQRIQAKVDRGNGKAASIYGQTYDVYRLSAKSAPTGVVTAASLIASSVAVSFEKLTAKADVEIESSARALFFTGVLNLGPFQPGDVFVQRTDAYRYDRGVFTLASARPMPHGPVFVSTPIYATLSRPESNPQHIDSGIAPQSVPIKEHEWPLTLTPGTASPYAFLQVGTPVTVPIGMVMGRLRDYPRTDSSDGQLYDDTRRQTWDVFAPQLPGQPLIPRDIVTGSTGDRYEITGIQSSYASFFGQLLTVQRIRS